MHAPVSSIYSMIDELSATWGTCCRLWCSCSDSSILIFGGCSHVFSKVCLKSLKSSCVLSISVAGSIFPFNDTTKHTRLITPETGSGWIPLSWIVTIKPEHNKKKNQWKRGVEGGETPSWQIKDRFTTLIEEKSYFLSMSVGLSLSSITVNVLYYICDTVNVV